MTLYEGQRAEQTATAGKEKRVVNLTRSSYTGQQRYGTILWSGAAEASWDTLKKQIAAGLNFCTTGLPQGTLGFRRAGRTVLRGAFGGEPLALPVIAVHLFSGRCGMAGGWVYDEASGICFSGGYTGV